MAENLRYLPKVGGTTGYAVANYNGTNPRAARQTEEFQNFGVYYTWDVAVAGNHNYNNKVQGICPEGWHMPHSSDYFALEELIANDGKKLKKKDTGFWETNNGTDEYGFAALAGGYIEDGEWKEFKNEGHWWTKVGIPDENPNKAIPFIIKDNGTTSRYDVVNTRYHNVRCIKEKLEH